MRIFLVFSLMVGLAGICFAEIQTIEKACIMREYDRAVVLAEQYLNKSSKNKDKVLFLLAEAYMGNGHLLEARETLRSLYKEFPDSAYCEKAVIKIGDTFFVYFDRYRENRFGAVTSTDLNNWQDITGRINFPEGARHGTVFQVSERILQNLLSP